MTILGIIPARFASTRLEGKPLLDIAGKSMIRRVYEQAKKAKSLTKIIVATDDQRIVEECIKYQLNYMMTSSQHTNGTERCGEVIGNIEEKFDLVVNIQGDEPFIHPESIDEIVQIFKDNPKAEIGTLIKKISNPEYLSNPSIIKVASDLNGKAHYFSRSPIPFLRDVTIENWLEKEAHYKHIGMYGYKSDILCQLVMLKESRLEKLEKLEQLRWLENGYEIYVQETIHESKSIDTKEDYQYILENIENYNHD